MLRWCDAVLFGSCHAIIVGVLILVRVPAIIVRSGWGEYRRIMDATDSFK